MPSRYICIIVRIPYISQSLCLNFKYSASPQKEKLVGVVHEITPVPDSGRKNEGREVEEETVPVPYKFERVEHVVEYCHRYERLV